MMRRCSHCSHNGHNSRTCPNRGVKLFGVRLTDGSIRKSASMGNLCLLSGSSGGSSSPGDAIDGGGGDGYVSEDFGQGSSSSCGERKKGSPWTEEEHRMFLLGLKKLGKGDWRGISRNYVVSRTPTQVASHAQKYFIRQTNFSRRRRRSSLFDMVPYEPLESQTLPMNCQESAAPSRNPLPIPPKLEEECESMDSTNLAVVEATVSERDTPQCNYPVVLPTYFSPFMQYPFPYWPVYKPEVSDQQGHEIVRPTAVHSKAPINVDGLLGISKLSIGDSVGEAMSSLPPLHLIGIPNRQSAFHVNPPTRAQA